MSLELILRSRNYLPTGRRERQCQEEETSGGKSDMVLGLNAEQKAGQMASIWGKGRDDLRSDKAIRVRPCTM